MSTGVSRERWGTRIGLILAMAGNAVGLGNFLRFPVQAAENGGGAFMIPYFVSFLLLGIPLMWVEWTIGRYGGVRGHGTTPGMFEALWNHPLAKYLGALGVFMPLIVVIYYTFVESWSLGFSLFSLLGAFGEDRSIESMTAFLESYQGAGEQPAGSFGNIGFGWFTFPTAAYGFFLVTLGINLYFLYRGVRGGIERVALIAMPALFLLAILILVRVLTLGTPDPTQPDNSILNGLAFIWNPNLTELRNPTVWMAAAGQVFFTLSLGMGTLHCYASYLREKDDVALSGLATAATNETAEVILGGTIAIPAAVAFFGVTATMQLASAGAFNLGFVTMPVVFHQIPAGDYFGSLWFLLLFIAGITSSLAQGQAVVAFLEDEFGLSRQRAVLILGAVIFVAIQPVILFMEYRYLDELDFWAGTFGLFVFGAVEVILFSWVFGINRGWAELNRGADIRPLKVFKFILGWVTPVIMIGIFILWTAQNAIDTALMVGVDDSIKPFVLAARIFMILTMLAILYLIRRAWRQRPVPQETTA